MDTFVTTAIIGTGQQSQPDITTGSAVDQVASQLPADTETERKLLLTAGAWSVYRQAGKTLQTHQSSVVAAPAEQLPTCSTQTANQIEHFLQRNNADLLPEALALLQQAGQRLPYDLLSQALDYGKSNKEMRTVLLPVLGERGFWLSQFNDNWSWATEARAVSGEELPDDAETTWQEGTIEQRCAILRLLRASDATRAREWLNEVWKQEKAEARQNLLNTFEVGISGADEEFLEKALDDRSEYVRHIARKLLGSIPNSAFAQRMLVRADEILQEGRKVIRKGAARITLQIKLPEPIPQSWQRDGIESDLKKNSVSEIVQKILTHVPPTHWEERFAASPKMLIETAQHGDHTEVLLSGWTEATCIFHTRNWLSPIFDHWHSQDKKRNSSPGSRSNYADLLQDMPLDEAEQKFIEIFSDLSNYYTYQYIDMSSQFLPTPWQEPFARTILRSLKDFVSNPKQRNYTYSWSSLLTLTATSLPESCFEAAITGWKDLEEQQNSNMQEAIQTFIQRIQIRKFLIKEIQLSRQQIHKNLHRTFIECK